MTIASERPGHRCPQPASQPHKHLPRRGCLQNTLPEYTITWYIPLRQRESDVSQSQSSHSESPQSAELVRVTLTFDHQLTDSELEQLKQTTEALEVRVAGPRLGVFAGESAELAPGAKQTLIATAPTGWYFLSGGGLATDDRTVLYQSYPNPSINARHWIVSFVNKGPVTTKIESYILCQQVSG